jgi:hypothetical protein
VLRTDPSAAAVRASIPECGRVSIQKRRESRQRSNLATKDVRDAHLVIVHDVRQVVGREAVRLEQHRVRRERCVCILQRPKHEVIGRLPSRKLPVLCPSVRRGESGGVSDRRSSGRRAPRLRERAVRRPRPSGAGMPCRSLRSNRAEPRSLASSRAGRACRSSGTRGRTGSLVSGQRKGRSKNDKHQGACGRRSGRDPAARTARVLAKSRAGGANAFTEHLEVWAMWTWSSGTYST